MNSPTIRPHGRHSCCTEPGTEEGWHVTDEPEQVEIPAGRLSPEMIMFHEDLFSVNLALGKESVQRVIREGGVSFGTPMVERLSPKPGGRPRRSHKTDRASVLIGCPFDLDDVTGSREY